MDDLLDNFDQQVSYLQLECREWKKHLYNLPALGWDLKTKIQNLAFLVCTDTFLSQIIANLGLIGPARLGKLELDPE